MSTASTLNRIRRHPLAAHLEATSEGPLIHAVGGIVRDALLGRDSADLDLTVAERGEQLARRIARASGGTQIALGGDRFSSHRVVAGAFQADIWDRAGKSLRSDLERRDLTINAIACALDEAGDGLEDPFGGVEDLAAQTLRATKPDCFERDPLRVLRLARFRLLLSGFEFEAGTAAAARAAVGGLAHIATERIRDEMQRILESPSATSAFETLRSLEIMKTLVPATARRAVARLLLERSRRLDGILAVLAPWDGPDRRHAALALLAAAAGEDDLNTGAAELETRGLATRRSLATARALCGEPLPETEAERRLFLDRHRQVWRLALAVTATMKEAGDHGEVAAVARQLEQTARSAPGLLEGLPLLLDGHQAARILGIDPGPELGRALGALGRAHALGTVSSRVEAEQFLRRLRSQAARKLESAATSGKPEDAD